MLAVSPRWLLHLLPWVNISGGVYQVNRRRIVLAQHPHRRRPRRRARLDRPGEALRSVPFLRAADVALREATSELLFDERHNSNEVLYSAGDPATKLYIVVQGKVEISTTDAHGAKIRLAIYGEGDWFGEGALTGDGTHARPYRVRDAGSRSAVLDAGPSSAPTAASRP